MNSIKSEIKFIPKELIDEGHKVSTGDFVTISNTLPITVYIVKEYTPDKMSKICGISLTESCDDVVIREYSVPSKYLIYLGDSFANVGGILWNLRDRIMSAKCE